MSNKKTVKNIISVTLSNILKLISSILIGFVIPKILGVTDYGYYKIFILYMTYVGLFHFGFIDGIYLKFGGVEYDKLDKLSFRYYFRFLLQLECVIAILGFAITLIFVEGEKKFIFLMLFINLISVNTVTFFQFVSQITSRFKEYSSRIIILSFANILIVCLLYFFSLESYKIYIILIVLMNFILLFWYIYSYRDIVFGARTKFIEEKNEIYHFFKNGGILLLANLSTTLVLTVNKQIVEIFFSVDDFAIYSFAYSMLAIITVVVTAVSVVLYPTFKRIELQKLISKYSDLNRIIIFIVMIGLIGYFPLEYLIPRFLPEYTDSIIIFRIALPGLFFSSTISAIKHNYFKVLNKNNFYFYISFLVILLNIVIILCSYSYSRSMISIAISSIFGLVLWYIVFEVYMIRKYRVSWILNATLLSITIGVFYVLSSFENSIYSMCLYSLFVVLTVFLSYRKSIVKFIQRRKTS